jgi:hypothetical protein
MRARTIGILLAQVIGTVSNSFRRVRLIKWAFTHPQGDKIEYSVQTHQAGLELRVTLNAELLHLQVFSGPDELARAAREGGNRLEANGWLHQQEGEAVV